MDDKSINEKVRQEDDKRGTEDQTLEKRKARNGTSGDSYHLGGGIWGWHAYDGVTGEYTIGDSMKNVP
ncbi:MAG: hypothetical protein AABX04_05175 [Nanoarchaeota archaeon]